MHRFISRSALGCYKPLYATMLQAVQCYCGSWCGLGLTVLPPPKRSSGASKGIKVKIISRLLFLRTFTQPGTPPVYICHHAQVLTKRHASLSVRAADMLEQRLMERINNSMISMKVTGWLSAVIAKMNLIFSNTYLNIIVKKMNKTVKYS